MKSIDQYLKECRERCEKATNIDECVCGETSARNCSVHQGANQMSDRGIWIGWPDGENPECVSSWAVNESCEYYVPSSKLVLALEKLAELEAHARTDVPTLLRVIEKLLQQRHELTADLYDDVDYAIQVQDAELDAIVKGEK